MKLKFPKKLGELGVRETDFVAIADESMRSGNMKVNPRKADIEDIVKFLREAL